DRGEGRGQPHHALLGADLLAQDVAIEAAALVLVVLARLAQLSARLVEDDRNRGDPRIRMMAGHPRLLVAARDEGVTDLSLPPEIEQAIAIHPQDRLERRRAH